MYQHTLFPCASNPRSLPYVRHSETSKAAAEKAAVKAPSNKAMVLACIKESGETGFTDNELINVLKSKMSLNSIRARRVDLTREKKVIEAGERNGCTVWVAVKP